MLNKREIVILIATTLVLAFVVSMFNLKEAFLVSLAYMAIIIFMNVLTKKSLGQFLDIKVDIKLWQISKFGFSKQLKSRKPIAIGIFLPLILKLITVGFLNWTAALVFDVKAKVYRSAKKHGLYAFTEMSEAQIGAIAASGIGINIILAILGYFAGFPAFARLSLGFAFFNMIPISNLDGNKIFFGSTLLWTFLAVIVLLGVLATFLIV